LSLFCYTISMQLKIKKLHPDAIVPTYAHEGDAGMDLYCVEEIKVPANGGRASIKTGLAFEIPHGYVGLIWEKSGLSHKHGLKTFGGVIDAGYRGELTISLINLSPDDYLFEKSHKIAQMLIQPIIIPEIIEADSLSETSRGEGGFGSTGK